LELATSIFLVVGRPLLAQSWWFLQVKTALKS